MITCPWCGTNYAVFQTNCKNCGGPLPPPPQATPPQQAAYTEDVYVDEPVELPPPAPRPISDSYAMRMLMSDGWAVSAFVFLLLGGIFTCVGAGLTVGVMTAFVGIPFVLMGLGFLGGGGAIVYWRYEEARKVVRVLRDGEATTGRITATDINSSVQINGRHPWTIRYQFRVNGRDYEGRVSTLNTPSLRLRPGRFASVLYLPNDPGRNALYPHP